jgi:nucleotidyltransferase substrate binding protein (TIGR01987 family)
VFLFLVSKKGDFMLLDLSSFQKAIASLENAISVFNSDATKTLAFDTQEVIKAGVIQNFEFTYELSHKMLKRYLEMSSANPAEINDMSFPDLIRTGSEKGLLLNGWDVWMGYRTARGTTSHTYDKGKATEVLFSIPGFLDEARYLQAELEKRNSEPH